MSVYVKYAFMNDKKELLGLEASARYCSFDNFCEIEYELTTGEPCIWFSEHLSNALIVASGEGVYSKEKPYLSKHFLNKTKIVAMCSFDGINYFLAEVKPQNISDIVSTGEALLYSSYVYKNGEFLFDKDNFEFVKAKNKQGDYKIDYSKVFYIMEKQLKKTFFDKKNIKKIS